MKRLVKRFFPAPGKTSEARVCTATHTLFRSAPKNLKGCRRTTTPFSGPTMKRLVGGKVVYCDAHPREDHAHRLPMCVVVGHLYFFTQ